MRVSLLEGSDREAAKAFLDEEGVDILDSGPDWFEVASRHMDVVRDGLFVGLTMWPQTGEPEAPLPVLDTIN